MKIFISADMEGETGVTGYNDVSFEKPPYERFRKLLTGDVNAAIEAAFDAGTTEILVKDAHHSMRNILIEELNPKARLISGSEGKKLCMMEGVNRGFDAAFLIAYHAMAGTEGGVLHHSTSWNIHNFWINGVLMDEAGISASLVGYYDVPIALVTGDDKVTEQTKELLGNIETAVVKEGSTGTLPYA